MGSKKDKPQKIRTDFRKNRAGRVREGDLTREFQQHGFQQDESARTERVSGKGELARKRTVRGTKVSSDVGLAVHLDVDEAACLRGRVLRVHGLISTVETEDGKRYQCATRRLLKTLTTDQRHVVTVGDIVLFRSANNDEGIIERIEPRHGVLCRTSRSRQQVVVANVDLLLIISSAAEPTIKPNLIDRLLVTAEKSDIAPVICINKIDLVDPADLQPLVGVYGQLGYQVLLLSGSTGFGVDPLREMIRGRQSVLMGQSGVGKSTLLNAVQPGLDLRVRDVSSDTEKGRHTTTTAQLIRLEIGGYVVDTPGMRQFCLWNVSPEEVVGFYVDLRPYVNYCKFPDCTHRHEAECAVKDAVADGRLDARRYESYCRLFEGDGD